MKKFTFNDWLEDRLTGEEFAFMGDDSLIVVLGMASRNPEIVNPEDYKRIRECQNETYGLALEMTLKSLKEIYLSASSQATDKEHFRKLEITTIEQFLNKDIKRYQYAMTGVIDTNGIKGSTYKRVKGCFDRSQERNTRPLISIPESEVFPYSLQAKYLDWLNDQNKKRDRKGQNFTYIQLFRSPYNTDPKQKELFTILLTKGYIDKLEKWVGIGNKNEFAAFYQCVKEKAFIAGTKDEPSIPIFAHRFGLTIDEGKNSFCSIRNMTQKYSALDARDEFTQMLNGW